MKQEHDARIHYIHRLGPGTRERIAGAFVLAGLALLAALIIGAGRSTHLFDDRIHYRAILRNAQGLSTDSRVRVAGIEVGQITDFHIDDKNRINIGFFVYEHYRPLLRQDSWGSLSRSALIGDAYLDIKAGDPAQPMLPPGAWVPIIEPLTPEQIMERVKPILLDLEKSVHRTTQILARIDPEAIDHGSERLVQTIDHLEAIARRIRNGEGSLGKAVNDPEMARNLERSLAALARTLAQAERRLAQSEPLLEELQGVARETRELTRQMNSAMRVVNTELQQLPELMSRMQLLLEATERTLQGVQRIWPVSSAIRPETEEILISPEQGE